MFIAKITKELVYTMAVHCLECYKKEGYGVIYGTSRLEAPHTIYDCRIITPLDALRYFTHVECCEKELKRIPSKVEENKLIGEFHSHTDGYNSCLLCQLSDDDINTTDWKKFPLQFLVCIKARRNMKEQQIVKAKRSKLEKIVQPDEHTLEITHKDFEIIIKAFHYTQRTAILHDVIIQLA